MRKKVSLLGSTGSVGVNTLNVIREHKHRYEIFSLSSGGASLPLFVKQIEEFKPRFVSVSSAEIAEDLRGKLPSDLMPAIFFGPEGHRRCVEESMPDILMSSMSGTHGLQATLRAVQLGVATVGVANKEILVMAGPFIANALQQSHSRLVPVDSEHSAIFQALMGNQVSYVKNLWLTGSGGPFRTRDPQTFASITKDQALKHPNWSMGAKITIDSATMMNKGLEFIEAIRLFNLPAAQVKIVIHPESVLHSLVEYVDGSWMAQLGISDMKIPISLALAYPDRLPLELSKQLDLVEWGSLHFEKPDYEKFPCLRLAQEAEAMGPEGPIVLNAANEIAVDEFLKDRLHFIQIPELVESALSHFKGSLVTSLDEVTDLDRSVKNWSRIWKSGLSTSRREFSIRETIQG